MKKQNSQVIFLDFKHSERVELKTLTKFMTNSLQRTNTIWKNNLAKKQPKHWLFFLLWNKKSCHKEQQNGKNIAKLRRKRTRKTSNEVKFSIGG